MASLTDIAAIMRTSIRKFVATQPHTPPVSLDSFFDRQTLRIVVAPFHHGLEASLILSTDPALILINTNIGPFAQRFALAHELIHYWHHQKYLSTCTQCSHDYQNLLETEANAGAAELLLPYDWFMDTARIILRQPLLSSRDFDNFLASSAAKHWAGRARVTVPVLGYHLRDLGWAPPVPPSALSREPVG